MLDMGRFTVNDFIYDEPSKYILFQRQLTGIFKFYKLLTQKAKRFSREKT